MSAQQPQVHCNECGHDGEPVTNSRNQTRCQFCYSLNVTFVEPPQIVVTSALVTTPAKPQRKTKGAGA